MSAPPRAEILSQGDEVVTGQVADTNAAWLATQLTAMGFDVVGHTSVGDRLSDLEGAIDRIAQRADLILGTGGLGPTRDDLTAEAVANTTSDPLELDPRALSDLEAKYARYGREMAEVNRKQAWLPSRARRIDNDWGTAPGFWAKHHGCLMAFMPGVPREMRAMFRHRIQPELHELFDVQSAHLVTLRTVGRGESDLQQRLRELDLPDDVTLGFRTVLPENHIKLRFPSHTPFETIQSVAQQVATRVSESLFSVEGCSLQGFDSRGGSLAEHVGRRLVSRSETIACAESCTGGRIASMCTAVSGSSAWFMEGAITYSNASKVRSLGVPASLIDAYGAVSEPVAKAMADGIRTASGATYGISSTGIAGPNGGTPNKPVGTVHIAVASADAVHHRTLTLGGDRHRIQTLASSSSLDLLRRTFLID